MTVARPLGGRRLRHRPNPSLCSSGHAPDPIPQRSPADQPAAVRHPPAGTPFRACSGRGCPASNSQMIPNANRPAPCACTVAAASTAGCRRPAPTGRRSRTVARSCRAPTARRRPRHRAKCANAANVRFKRTQTAQAFGITWIDYNGASSSHCSAARRLRGRSRARATGGARRHPFTASFV